MGVRLRSLNGFSQGSSQGSGGEILSPTRKKRNAKEQHSNPNYDAYSKEPLCLCRGVRIIRQDRAQYASKDEPHQHGCTGQSKNSCEPKVESSHYTVCLQ